MQENNATSYSLVLQKQKMRRCGLYMKRRRVKVLRNKNFPSLSGICNLISALESQFYCCCLFFIFNSPCITISNNENIYYHFFPGIINYFLFATKETKSKRYWNPFRWYSGQV